MKFTSIAGRQGADVATLLQRLHHIYSPINRILSVSAKHLMTVFGAL
jgi:hypothetical protein